MSEESRREENHASTLRVLREFFQCFSLHSNVNDSLKEFDIDPVVPFPPVVENVFQSEEEAFIPSFRFNKHSLDIPWLVGITSDEGLLRTSGERY